MFYLDRDLNFHIIESAPSKNLAQIEKCLKMLEQVQQEYDLDDAPVRSLLDLIADLGGVKRSLLHENVDEMLNAIVQVNFTTTLIDETDTQTQTQTETQTEKLSLIEYHYKLVAQLVNSELCRDLKSAIALTERMPYKDVEGIIEARIKFLNRDKIEQEKQQAEAIALEKVVDEQIAEGQFFDDLLDPATAGKTRVDLSAFRS